MKVVLVARIPVVRYVAFAEVAWLELRPELGLLCSEAAKNSDSITAERIEKLLPGVPEKAAENIVRWCEALGLCDTRGSLTQLGRAAGDSNLVPMPEQGVYDFWTADHPLMGTRILHALRVTSKPDQRFDTIDFENLEEVPLYPDKKIAFQSVVDPDKSIVMRSFEINHGDQCCFVKNNDKSDLDVSWHWDFSPDSKGDRWTLEGELDVEQGNVKHIGESSEVDLDDRFAELADHYLRHHGSWDRDKGKLAVAFASLKEGNKDREIKSFATEVELQQGVEVRGFGEFTQVRIQKLPLKPATQKDAQNWARARLHQRLGGNEKRYYSREEVRRIWMSCVEGTPLEEFETELPPYEPGGYETDDNPAAYWSLVAPVDLSPEPVPEAVLGAMKIKPPVADPQDTHDSERIPRSMRQSVEGGSVRIPHQARWSMGDLVGKLVGDRVRRVVLCDKYVRGPKNLKMLALLAETIRQTSPSAKIKIITERPSKTGGDHFADIRSCVGTEPETYQQAFGDNSRNHPHDRYLLVSGEDGTFAWQMSNSPLDARARRHVDEEKPTTVLGWRDFSAMRLSLEELPSDLSCLIGDQQ